jgi:hypothetical protein
MGGHPTKSLPRSDSCHPPSPLPPSLALLPLPNIPVGGRLQHFHLEWSKWGVNPYIVNIIQHGLTLEFIEKPPLSTVPIFMESYQGDRIRHKALQAAVQELLSKQVLEPVARESSPGFYSRLFLTPKQDGTWRVIIDLSEINQYIKNESFQMETAASIQKSLRPDMFVTSIDLKDAYYHLPVHVSYRKYLRVALLGQVYQFRAMPMGLNVSARIFTKVVLEVLKIARVRGIHLNAFLDDWLQKNMDRLLLREQTLWLVRLCTSLGWIVNFPKSQLDATQVMTYVGSLYLLRLGLVTVPEPRLEKMEALICSIIKQGGATARRWSSLIGSLGASMNQVKFGPLHRRSVQWILISQWEDYRNPWASHKWNDWVPLPEEDVFHLEWWLDRRNTTRGMPLVPFLADMTLYTDASKFGYGATLENQEFSGAWTPEERVQHSNNLEMLAVVKSVSHFQRSLRNKSLLVSSDNTTTVATINRQGGIRSMELNALAWDLWKLADQLNCNLQARHIPGRLNVIADSLSRRNQVVSTEWSLDKNCLQELWRVLDRPLIDLFATSKNFQMPIYVSPFPDPAAWKINAMTFSWSNQYLYAFPPWQMLGEVLLKVMEDQARMILIAPKWEARPWYPLLQDLLSGDPIKLPQYPSLLKQPHTNHKHNDLVLLNLHAWPLLGRLQL